jgi:hypothetical protein
VTKFRNLKTHLLAHTPEQIRNAVDSAVIPVVGNRSLSLKGLVGVKRIFPAGSRHMGIVPWEKATKLSKIQIALEAILDLPSYKVLKLSINLSPTTEQIIEKASNLNYARDEIRKAIRLVVVSGQILFFILEEKELKSRRLHFHGAIAVPSTMDVNDTCRKIEKAISRSPISRKYTTCNYNKTVDVGHSYRSKHDPTNEEKPVDGSWGTYITKHYNSSRKQSMSREIVQVSKSFLDKFS